MSSRIANDNRKSLVTVIVNLLIASLVSCALIFGCTFIYSKFNDVSKLEGKWIEQYENEKGEFLYGIAEIEYDRTDEMLYFDGTGFGEDGIESGTWSTVISYYRDDKLRYAYEGTSDLTKSDYDRKGFGYFNLRSDHKSASGRYFSYSTDSLPRIFRIEKIENKKWLEDLKNDEKEFIKRLYSGEIEVKRFKTGPKTKNGDSLLEDDFFSRKPAPHSKQPQPVDQ